MALSFKSVQKAYEVFHTIKKEHLPELQIPSWPQDMGEWTEEEKNNPPKMIVLGSDKKSDGGWESICFFVENPSKELLARFDELETQVPNSAIRAQRNTTLWRLGWF